MTYLRLNRAVRVFLILVLIQAVSIKGDTRAENEELRLEKLNLNIGRIESDFAKLLKERDKLREEVSSMRVRMKGMQDTNASLSRKLKATIDAANQKLEKSNGQKNRLVTKLNAFNDKFKEMNEEIDELEEDNDSLTKDFEEAKKKGRTAAARLNSGKLKFQEEVSSLKNRVAILTNARDSLDETLDDIKRSSQEKILKLATQKKNLVSKMFALNDKLRDAHSRLEKLASDRTSLKETLASAKSSEQEKIASLTAQKNDLASKLSAGDIRLKDMEATAAELAEAKSSLEKLAAENRDFDAILKTSEAKIKELADANLSLNDAFTATKMVNAHKIEQLTTEKNALASKYSALDIKVQDSEARVNELVRAKISFDNTLAAAQKAAQEKIEALTGQSGELTAQLTATNDKLQYAQAKIAELADVRASLKEATGEKDSLTSRLSALGIKLRDSQARISKLDRSNASLADKLAGEKKDSVQNINRLTQDKDVLHKKITYLKDHIKDLGSQKLLLSKQLKETTHTSKKHIKKLAGQKDALATRLSVLEVKFIDSREKINKLANAKAALDAEKNDLGSKLSALDIKLKGSEAQVSKLSEAKSSLSGKNNDLVYRLHDLDAKFKDSETKIAELAKAKTELTVELAATGKADREKIEGLTGERDDLATRLSALDIKFKDSETKIDELAKAKTELTVELAATVKADREKIEGLTGERDDLATRLSALDIKFKDSEAKIAELADAKAALNTERDDLASRLSALDIKFKDSQAKIGELAKAKSDLANKFAAAKNTHKDKVETLIAQRNELASRISGFEGKLKGSEVKMSEVTFSRTLLEDQVNNLEKDKLSLSEKLEKTTDADEKKIEKLSAQKNDLISKISDYDMKLKYAEAKIDKLARARTTLNKTLAATREINKKRIKTLVGQKNELASRLSDLDIKLIRSDAKIDELVKTKVTLNGTLSATRTVDQKKIEALIGQKEELASRLTALGINLKNSEAMAKELARAKAAMANRFTAVKQSNQEKIEALIQNKNEFASRVSVLNDRLKDSETKVGEVVFSRTLLEDRIKELDTENIVLSKKLEETMETSQQQIAELTGRNNDLVSRLSLLDDKLKDSEARIDELANTRASQDNTLSSTKKKPGALAGNSAALGRRTGSLDNRLIDMTSSGNSLIKILSGKSQAIRKPGDTADGAKRITFDIKDADIKDVLDTFAQLYDVEIITEDEVEGKVSINLINMDPYKALGATLKKCGYVYSIRQDAIIVRKDKE